MNFTKHQGDKHKMTFVIITILRQQIKIQNNIESNISNVNRLAQQNHLQNESDKSNIHDEKSQNIYRGRIVMAKNQP